MYILDLNDVIFFVRSLKSPHEGVNIENFISFTSGDTRPTTTALTTFTSTDFHEFGMHSL